MLKPHFYIVNLGYAGVYLHVFFFLFSFFFFFFLLQNIDCGYSLEPPTIYVLSKNKKNIKTFFLLKLFNFYSLRKSVYNMGMFL